MPRIKLTKPVLDALQPSGKDEVYWDAGLPGFGVKVTLWSGNPRRGQAAAQKILAARLDGRDPALEKRQARRRSVSDSIEVQWLRRIHNHRWSI